MLDRTKRTAASLPKRLERKHSVEKQADDDDSAAAAAASALQTIAVLEKDNGGPSETSSVLEDAGHVSDEASGTVVASIVAEEGEEVFQRVGGRKRTRPSSDNEEDPGEVDDAKTTASSSSTEENGVRRSKRARVSKGGGGSPAASPPSDSMQLRSRRQVSYAPPAKKPAPPSKKHPGTSMKLRKRSASSANEYTAGHELAAARCLPVLDGSVSDEYKTYRRSIETAECEVCLHPYALSYLSKHRNKVHGLPHLTLGCPHCAAVFSSPSQRFKHIADLHPGKPSSWRSVDGSCKDLSKVKVHLYPCPLCPSHFTHSGLVCHLGSSHNTSIDAFQGRIYSKCPFCMASPTSGKKLSHFTSEAELREHIARKHKGCFLLDDIEPPPGRTFERPSIRSAAAAASGASWPKKLAAHSKKAPLPLQEEEESSSEDQDASPIHDEEEEPQEDHWNPLQHNGLLADYVYGDYVPMDFGMNLPSAIKAVDDELQALARKKDASDEEYIAEMKLYNKGLKARQRMADAERIEKERHREEVERELLQLEYENRKKKKRPPEDVEHDALIGRRISFVASSRKANCPFGKHCELCVSHDREPKTDASGQLIDAPSYHGTVVDDSLNAVSSPEKGSAGDDDGGRRNRRRGRRVDSTTRSILMLQELNHSLRFVAEYNSGYFRR